LSPLHRLPILRARKEPQYHNAILFNCKRNYPTPFKTNHTQSFAKIIAQGATFRSQIEACTKFFNSESLIQRGLIV
jgi:hypothetical protein